MKDIWDDAFYIRPTPLSFELATTAAGPAETWSRRRGCFLVFGKYISTTVSEVVQLCYTEPD